jgi:hypothetical protein
MRGEFISILFFSLLLRIGEGAGMRCENYPIPLTDIFYLAISLVKILIIAIRIKGRVSITRNWI